MHYKIYSEAKLNAFGYAKDVIDFDKVCKSESAAADYFSSVTVAVLRFSNINS
jgi:hypothetical protein